MSDKIELTWQEYEEITQYIYGALGAERGVKVRSYGKDSWVTGKSGVKHQVDVLTEQFEGNKILLTAIECKYAKKKVTKGVVMTLFGVMQDAGIASGVIVCKAGFTNDTLTYAAHMGIKLVKLWEAGESEAKTIELGTLNLKASIQRYRPKITSIELGNMIIVDDFEIMAMYQERLFDNSVGAIRFSEFISAFSNELQSRHAFLEPLTISYPLNRKLSWWTVSFHKITLTGFLTKSDLSFQRSFQIVDRIWMIINELFDDRKLTLSKSGLLWNLPFSHDER